MTELTTTTQELTTSQLSAKNKQNLRLKSNQYYLHQHTHTQRERERKRERDRQTDRQTDRLKCRSSEM